MAHVHQQLGALNLLRAAILPELQQKKSNLYVMFLIVQNCYVSTKVHHAALWHTVAFNTNLISCKGYIIQICWFHKNSWHTTTSKLKEVYLQN